MAITPVADIAALIDQLLSEDGLLINKIKAKRGSPLVKRLDVLLLLMMLLLCILLLRMYVNNESVAKRRSQSMPSFDRDLHYYQQNIAQLFGVDNIL